MRPLRPISILIFLKGVWLISALPVLNATAAIQDSVSTAQFVGGVAVGAVRSVTDLVKGVGNMLAHPREAMRNISLLIHNPKAVGSIVANETWHYCNSSAYHAGVCAGQVAGTVALGALTDGLGELAELSRAVTVPVDVSVHGAVAADQAGSEASR